MNTNKTFSGTYGETAKVVCQIEQLKYSSAVHPVLGLHVGLSCLSLSLGPLLHHLLLSGHLLLALLLLLVLRRLLTRLLLRLGWLLLRWLLRRLLRRLLLRRAWGRGTLLYGSRYLRRRWRLRLCLGLLRRMVLARGRCWGRVCFMSRLHSWGLWPHLPRLSLRRLLTWRTTLARIALL